MLPYVPTPGAGDDADLEMDDEDSAIAIPKSVVIDPHFDWEDDRPPNTPLHETVIYETHVKGFTMRHPDVREDLRGTYAGLADPAALEYLKELGVTAVELLPVHHIADESFLAERGLTNYWGYSTIGFFAPFSSYAATGIRGQEVREFKGMVKALHRAGIEVILDVVYNHTAEGNHLGPMLSFKGVDNASYYRLMPEDPHHYMDFTGTGNSLNPVHPSVLRLIMDSLRYWVTECHVDGFRFDLASALARELYDVDRLSAFFDTIHQDPVLSPGQADRRAVGRRPGRLPGRQLPRAVVGVERHVPRRDARLLARAGERRRLRLAPHRLERPLRVRRPPPVRVDQLHHRPRRLHAARPRLLQRQAQRGQPRGQPRRHRRQPLVELRRRGARPTTRRSTRCARASSATSSPRCCSRQGTPMLLGGDEFGRSQGGNNNAWCQDYEISWFDWEAVEGDGELLEFTRAADRAAPRAPGVPPPPVPARHRRGGLRAARRVVVPARRAADDQGRLGRRRRAAARHVPQRRGDRHARTSAGERIVDDSFVLLFNAGHEDAEFTLPPQRFGARVDVRAAHGRRAAAATLRRRARPCALAVALARAAAPQRA